MAFKSSDAYRAARENAKYFGLPYVVFVDTSGNWRSNSLRSTGQRVFAVVYPDGRMIKSSVETTVGELLARKSNPVSAVPTHEVSGFVRRLPSGQIQVKIPLSSLRRKKANPRRRRNIAGFMDSEGRFHPIRAGTRLKTKGKRKVRVADKRAYSRKKAGEKTRSKAKTRRRR